MSKVWVNTNATTMAITTSLVRDYRGRKKPSQEATIDIRLTINRSSYYISTGIKVRASEFSGGTIINRIDAPELNKRLEVLSIRAQHELNRMLEHGGHIDIMELRQRVWSAASVYSEDSFVDWAESSISASSLSAGTLKHYYPLFRRLRDFGQLRNWDDVSVATIYKFDEYLHALTNPQLSDAGVYTYHKCLKALLAKAERVGKISRNPYNRLRGEFSRGEKESIEYLTEEEMKMIIDFSPLPGSTIAMAKDLFVFQMFTGLSYSDAQRFDMSKYKLVDGRWISTQPRVKTGVPYVSVLLPPVVEVLKRNDWMVPRLTNQTYNHQLKQIGIAIDLGVRLHSHLARHTFATYMLRNGVKIENLARMLGHTNITQTQRYAKVLALSVQEDFDKISSLLEGRKTLASGELETSEN